ncbi:hypothetical protein AB3X93_02945 [Paraburkholderia sp. BR14262]
MVHMVQRAVSGGVVSEEVVLVDAYIPPQHRRSIFAPANSWKSSAVLRCSARVALNRKSLAAFIESGERKWLFQEAAR